MDGPHLAYSGDESKLWHTYWNGSVWVTEEMFTDNSEKSE